MLVTFVEDLIEKVPVHDTAKVLVPIAKPVDERTWRNGTLISCTPGNDYIEGAESEEDRGH